MDVHGNSKVVVFGKRDDVAAAVTFLRALTEGMVACLRHTLCARNAYALP
jgi:hypothetical protein